MFRHIFDYPQPLLSYAKHSDVFTTTPICLHPFSSIFAHFRSPELIFEQPQAISDHLHPFLATTAHLSTKLAVLNRHEDLF